MKLKFDKNTLGNTFHNVFYFVFYYMVRPCKDRRIEKEPLFLCFKPAGIPRAKLEKVDLNTDEYESIRLSDLELLSNKDGAEKMGISASTFNRLLSSGHKKLTDAIVNGKGIRVYRQDGTHNCNGDNF